MHHDLRKNLQYPPQMRNQMEKEETTIKPRWRPNYEKPKDHVPMISYKWKKGMSSDRT